MNPKIIAFAIEAHQRVNHLYDGRPYSVHLSMVAHYALKYIDCIPDDLAQNVIDACWLHDTIEDCRLTYNDIKEVAGCEVAEIVYAVTNEKGKNRKERSNDKYYTAIRQTAWAKYVKLCDRLANVKYSKETNSKMFSVYKEENEDFLKELFPAESERVHYRKLLFELYATLIN
jgi:(p)ppGpp synthase/HD superfamily hydrolase